MRLPTLIAAGFVVLSVIALTTRRQWLTRVGPVEVSDRVSNLKAENKRLKERWDAIGPIIESLERSVAYTRRC